MTSNPNLQGKDTFSAAPNYRRPEDRPVRSPLEKEAIAALTDMSHSDSISPGTLEALLKDDFFEAVMSSIQL